MINTPNIIIHWDSVKSKHILDIDFSVTGESYGFVDMTVSESVYTIRLEEIASPSSVIQIELGELRYGNQIELE